jgi:hypothetical protein
MTNQNHQRNCRPDERHAGLLAAANPQQFPNFPFGLYILTGHQTRYFACAPDGRKWEYDTFPDHWEGNVETDDSDWEALYVLGPFLNYQMVVESIRSFVAAGANLTYLEPAEGRADLDDRITPLRNRLQNLKEELFQLRDLKPNEREEAKFASLIQPIELRLEKLSIKQETLNRVPNPGQATIPETRTAAEL